MTRTPTSRALNRTALARSGVPGPNAIGATGGSGTRVVARLVRRQACFTGTDLNPYEDALAFVEYSEPWINDLYTHGEPPTPELLARMLDDYRPAFRFPIWPGSLRRPGPGLEGAKGIYLVSFLDAAMPSPCVFLTHP